MPVVTEKVARSNFGDFIVEAMHELAALIFAARTLAEAAPEFDNLDLVSKASHQHARKIHSSIDKASTGLLRAMRRKGRDSVETRVVSCRREHAARMAEAAALAETLARLRRKAYGDEAQLTDATDHMLQHLQAPLEKLARTWAAA